MANGVERERLRVSVIVPTYNRAGYLREALESIFSQRLLPWEVIVVDDGSTEDIAAVTGAYGEKVRTIRHEQNRGISAARNSGLGAARGDVIAWLDSDDLWEPEFLGTVVPMLEADPTLDGVYTGLARMDGSGKMLPQSSSWTVPPDQLYESLIESCSIQTSTFVARRRCYDRAGVFDPQFGICEDYDMFLRLARDARIVGIPTRLIRYRVHSQNTMAELSAYCRYRLALTEKHFGSASGDRASWADEQRRAHGYAQRAVALKCMEHGLAERGWEYMGRAVFVFPGLLGRLDTFYELALGDQPRGYRGQAELLDLDRNGAELEAGLGQLFADAPAEVQRWRRAAYGNAYLALAMLNDQAGRWKAARGWLCRALGANPALLREKGVARRLLKLCVGKRVIAGLRCLVGRRRRD